MSSSSHLIIHSGPTVLFSSFFLILPTADKVKHRSPRPAQISSKSSLFKDGDFGRRTPAAGSSISHKLGLAALSFSLDYQLDILGGGKAAGCWTIWRFYSLKSPGFSLRDRLTAATVWQLNATVQNVWLSREHQQIKSFLSFIFLLNLNRQKSTIETSLAPFYGKKSYNFFSFWLLVGAQLDIFASGLFLPEFHNFDPFFSADHKKRQRNTATHNIGEFIFLFCFMHLAKLNCEKIFNNILLFPGCNLQAHSSIRDGQAPAEIVLETT